MQADQGLHTITRLRVAKNGRELNTPPIGPTGTTGSGFPEGLYRHLAYVFPRGSVLEG